MKGVAQRGFVLPMLLGVIAVLGVLAAAMASASRTGVRQAQAVGEIHLLHAQAHLVRTKIVKCSFDYPGGDNGTGRRLSLPGALTDTAVSALTCPGAPSALQALWNGSDGVFLPNVPTNFAPWNYRNDATSARVSIQALDSGGLDTLNAVASRFSSAEVSVDSATRTLTLTIQH